MARLNAMACPLSYKIQSEHWWLQNRTTWLDIYNAITYFYSEESEEEELPLLTDEEMNKLGAKLVKAEIMGNTVSWSFSVQH